MLSDVDTQTAPHVLADPKQKCMQFIITKIYSLNKLLLGYFVLSLVSEHIEFLKC